MTHPHHAHLEHHKHSREELAKAEIGVTDSTPGINRFLLVFFVALIVAVPLSRNISEFRDIRAGKEKNRTVPQSWDVFSFLHPSLAELKAIARADSAGDRFEAAKAMNNRILRDIGTYEAALKDRDPMIQWLIPRMQTVITGWLRGGNEDAYCGQTGWLFYRRDVDSLTGRGFLEPHVLKQRAAGGNELKAPPQPDPVKAILLFRDQLAARGITLIVMPAPVKASIYPECYSSRYAGKSLVVQNPSYELFKNRLKQAGVNVFDPAPLLAEAKAASPAAPLYLKTDTHWTPAAMELTAGKLADAVRNTVALPPAQAGHFTTIEKTVENSGDVAMMLKLPAGQKTFPPETVRIKQVLNGKGFWRLDPKAEILFMGDSFANIYSLDPMGWGDSAGLAEHLSLALGLPLDVICRNDAGSYATREMLSKELQRGSDRLAGKKVVIWEFASRELACGDWKLLPMALGEKKTSELYVPETGRTVEVRATVRAVSFAPRPGSVPYKDHILMVHIADIESTDDPSAAGKEAVVFAWSMRDNKAMPASRHRPGDSVHFRLQPWSEVASKYKYEKINRSELDDEKLLLADPAWVADIGQEKSDGSPAVVPVPKQPGENPDKGGTVPAAGSNTNSSPATDTTVSAKGDAAGFRETCAKKAADGDSMAIAGSDGWLFLRSELSHIAAGPFWGENAVKVSKATSPENADPLPAILDFNEQLKASGIELIMVPVPCKALVYPEKINGTATERLDTVHQQFFKLLGDKGVKVLDLAGIFFKEKAKPGSPILYCKTDSHWSPYACEVTASKIREMIGAPAWLKGKPDVFKTRPETFKITGDLTEGKGSEILPVRFVQAAGITLEDRASPIVLLGDSHTLVFHAGEELHGTGAGLADQLAAELGIPVDVIGVRGSGATPARKNLRLRAKADPDYLAGKKVVIWCFAAREFTESTGWSLLKLGK